jgi:light-harvesting protein B-800-850 alpha chain
MNQAKIWLVVNPNHGLPLLWGSVTLISLLIHFMVLSHTSWYPGFWQGKAKPGAVSMASPDAAKPAAVAMVATQ